MKHEFEDLLRASARREVREAPAGLAERIRARLGDEALPRAEAAQHLPLRLVAGLAAAGLLAYALWRHPAVPPARESSPGSDALAVVELTQEGIQYAARADRPLADEWNLMVQDSLQFCDALLGSLPNLPR